MHGTNKVVATLLYGAGLRKVEALRLPIGDLNFDRKELLIRNAKGGNDRVTVLPESCIAPLKAIVERSRLWFEADMQEGISHIELPDALDRKFPNAGREFRRRFVFSSGNLSRCPRTGK